MIKIKGEIQRIERAQIIPPADGVHVAGKDGFIKGVHSFIIGNKLVPYGMVGFYWQIDDNVGVKVYYSIKHRAKTPDWKVKRIYRRMKKIWAETGINPKPIMIDTVKIRLTENGKPIKANALGIVTKHCHYPVEGWVKYAQGQPYDWDCYPHPTHTPQGFLSFQKQALRIARKYGADTRGKLGDILFDSMKQKWMLVDMG